MELGGLATAHFVGFLLVLFRLSGTFAILPLLGGSLVPWRVRVFIAVALSFAIYPVVNSGGVVMPMDLSRLVLGLAGELLVGMVCGFVVNLVFVAAQMAGTFLSNLMGLEIAEVMNPLFQTELPIFGGFYCVFAVVVFFAVNGHHILLAGLVKTFERVPLMGIHLHPGSIAALTALMGDMFVLMIRLAAPTFVAIFLVEVVLGIVARTVPQVNVLVAGFPLKICVGLLVTAAALAAAASLLTDSFSWIMGRLALLLRFMTA